MSDYQIDVIPLIKVNPCQITAYRSLELNGKAYHSTKAQLENLSKNVAHTSLSSKAVAKMRRSVDYLMFSASVKYGYNHTNYNRVKYRLVFVTLTLPSAQIHTDIEIKRDCLNHFLQLLRSKYGCKEYVWRQERQQNGNVHYHIVTDNFIPHQLLRDDWNRIVNKLGYVDRYREEQIKFHSGGFRLHESMLSTWPVKKQYEAYKRGCICNWSSPNSTDIHSLKFIVNLKNYLIKYMVKSDDCSAQVRRCDLSYKNSMQFKSIGSVSIGAAKYLRTISQVGRQWGCSYNLSRATGVTEVIDSKISDELDILRNSEGTRIFTSDYFTTIHFKFLVIYRLKLLTLISLFSAYIYDLFGLDMSKFIVM